MSVTLRQTQTTRQRIDFSGLLPETLCQLSADEIAATPLWQGNRQVRLDSLFSVERQDDPQQRLELLTLDDRIDCLGKQMRAGHILVHGDLGHYAGQAMQGGELHVDGSAGDYCGSGLRGGCVRVSGNVGDCLGAPAGGELRGQQGGLIQVRGNAGKRAGERQRRGLCVIECDTAELTAYRMIAGTLYVGGRCGPMTGHGMRRGSLLLRQAPQTMDENFRDNGEQRLSFLRMLLTDLQRQVAGALDDLPLDILVRRYLGDVSTGGCGEILILP
jgi:formylmethanofuran dehydrogenase subunit C